MGVVAAASIGIDLSGFYSDLQIPLPALHRVWLSPDNEPLAFKRFKFQELVIVESIPPSPQFLAYSQPDLRILDFWSLGFLE